VVVARLAEKTAVKTVARPTEKTAVKTAVALGSKNIPEK
jgi:hypothetical protein